MIQIDRAGVDYLIQVAEDIGFRVVSCITQEFPEDEPELKMEFIQTYEVRYKKPAEEPPLDQPAAPTQDKPSPFATLDD